MNIVLFERTAGYADDLGGYSHAFSWWPNSIINRGKWSVVSHVSGFADSSMTAVVDDFGSLVRVP